MVGVSIRVMIRFSVWLVSCYAHVCVLLQIVIVTQRSHSTLPSILIDSDYFRTVSRGRITNHVRRVRRSGCGVGPPQ